MDTNFFKRLFLAMALWMVVLIVFQLWLVPKNKTAPPTPPAPAALAAETPQPIISEEVTTVETAKFLIKLSDLGGSIKEIKIKDRQPGDPTGQPLPLLSPFSPEGYCLAVTTSLPGSGFSQARFQLEQPGPDAYIYRYQTPTGIGLSKKYIFSQDSHLITAEATFQNNGPGDLSFQYQVSAGSHIAGEPVFGQRFTDVVALVKGGVLDLRQGFFHNREPALAINEASWVALRNNHFCVALAPTGSTATAYRRAEKEGRDLVYAAGLKPAGLTLSPGASITHVYQLYAGPQDEGLLAGYGYEFKKVVFFGRLDWICQAVLKSLRFLSQKVGNYGLAIILLTFLINLILFPLTGHSQAAMMKNQEKAGALQAKIAQLRKKYGSDAQRLNQETIALYRKHGVNPFAGAGCLTMILQMPVFIALYITLAKAFELRGAPFLWIKDLSRPDAAFQLKGFTIPLLNTNAINILPILGALVMLLQQRLMNTARVASVDKEQAQQQKIMAIFFTVFLGFIFYNFPAGLNLYFLTNMVCMIGTQQAIRTRLKSRESTE